jgi:hypothetical protein
VYADRVLIFRIGDPRVGSVLPEPSATVESAAGGTDQQTRAAHPRA